RLQPVTSRRTASAAATRLWLSAKRPSAAHSGRPIASQRSFQWWSVGAAMATAPSRGSKTAEGRGAGGAVWVVVGGGGGGGPPRLECEGRGGAGGGGGGPPGAGAPAGRRRSCR